MNASDFPKDIQRTGWEHFQVALPELLQTEKDKWVAFHGAEQAALCDTKQEVYQALKDASVPLDEVVVRTVKPLGPPVLVRPVSVEKRK